MYFAKIKTRETIFLSGYILVLFTSAIVRDFVIAPYVAQHVRGIGAVLVEPIWKLVFWIVPTILYIQFVEHQNPLTYLKLSTNILKGLLWGLAGMLFLVIVELPLILRHTPHFHFGADTWLNVILLVGFMEEIPFRGFLFQKLQAFFGVVGAVLVSSLLFALIHAPLWVSTAQSVPSILINLFNIMLIAIVLCIALKISDSLWSSILIHVFYNLIQNIF
jgi:uncharacterized protein